MLGFWWRFSVDTPDSNAMLAVPVKEPNIPTPKVCLYNIKDCVRVC